MTALNIRSPKRPVVQSAALFIFRIQRRSRRDLRSFFVFSLRSEIEAIAKDHFGDQVVGGTGEADAQAEIKLPLRCDIQVDRGKKLVLLLGEWIESCYRAHGAVVFETGGDFASQVIAEFRVGRKHDALVDIFAVERPVQRRVQGPVPMPHLLVHDWADFPCPCIRGVLSPLIAEFVRDTDSDRPVPFFRNCDPGSNVIAHPLPALAFGYRSEDVKTAFEPVIKSVGNFDGLMLGVIRWVHSIDGFLGAVNREVAV
jgi:hypothetical protein